MRISKQVSFSFLFFYPHRERENTHTRVRIHGTVCLVSAKIMSRSENRETFPCATRASCVALLFTCNLETFAIERKIGSFSRGEKSSLPPGDEIVPVSHACDPLLGILVRLSRDNVLYAQSQSCTFAASPIGRSVPPSLQHGFLILLVPIF